MEQKVIFMLSLFNEIGNSSQTARFAMLKGSRMRLLVEVENDWIVMSLEDACTSLHIFS
jgi:hypothetical protein